MQIYEITLREAVPFMQLPPDDPKFIKAQADLAKRQAQAQAQSDAALKALQASNQPGSPGLSPGSQAGSQAFDQMAQSLSKTSSTTPTSSPPGTPPPPSAPPKAGTTTPVSTSAISNLDLRRDPNAPKVMPSSPSTMADIYAKKLQANPAQAAFAQRMAQLQKGQKTPTAATAPPPQELPPITLGSGPNAQVFINKGQGYVDKKTGAPMPPAIVKALGVK